MSTRKANQKEITDGNAPEDRIEIKIDPLYESLVPQMSDSEYNSLKESIRTAGQYTPIIVNQDNVVIDGHHRLRVCRELDIEPLFEVRHFFSKSEEVAFAIERNLTNLQHRHLKIFKRIELASKLEEMEAEKAHERQVRALKKGKKNLLPSGSIDPNGEEKKGRVAEKCATIAGVSPGSYKRGRYIILHGSEEIKEQVRTGELSILQAYDQLRPRLLTKKRITKTLTDENHRKAHEEEVRPFLTKEDIEWLIEALRNMTENQVIYPTFSKEYGSLVRMVTSTIE